MQEIAPGVAWTYTSFVNAYFIGEPGGPWALVDTGLPGFSATILAAAAGRYGPDARPEAIFLTHGHFDHAGNALALANHWNVPVYAHRLELPYLTGRSDYAPPDPTVGGAIAMFSRVLPYGATRPRQAVAGASLRTTRNPVRPVATADHCPVWKVGGGCTRRGIARDTPRFTANRTVHALRR